LRDFFVAFLIIELPDFVFLVFSLSDQAFVALFGLDDVVPVVFKRFVGLGAIRVDLDGVCQPP